MNSKQGVCTVFRAEHSVLRQTLSCMASLLRAGEWRRPGPALDRQRELIEFGQLFDEACHRPKGELLRQALRGRSAEVEGGAAPIDERGRGRGAPSPALQVHGLLAAVERNEPAAGDALPPLLEGWRAHLLHRLQWEDGVLLAAALAWLDGPEWERVAQAFEAIALPRAALYQLDATWTPARRRVESAARFEDNGFALDPGLSFERVPLFR